MYQSKAPAADAPPTMSETFTLVSICQATSISSSEQLGAQLSSSWCFFCFSSTAKTAAAPKAATYVDPKT